VNTVKTFVQKFGNDWSMNLVSMLTYSMVTTIFPLLLGILTIAGFVLGILSPRSFNTVVVDINNALPQNFANSKAIDIASLLKGLHKATGILATVSLLSLLFTGSNLFTNMENAFSIIFRVKDRDFLPQRIMGMGMVVVLALLLPLSLVAASLVTAGSAAFGSVLPQPLAYLLSFVGPLVSLGILWVLFLIIYRVVPNTEVPFRDAWRGALVAAVLFALLQLLFPLYFKTFLGGNAQYGAIAASALVLLTWLWFFCLITIIGAQVNSVALGLKPLPYDVARTLAEEYQRQSAPRPPRRRKVGPMPAPSGAQVAAARQAMGSAGQAVGSVLGLAGHVLRLPLRLLALIGWLVARPIVSREQ